MKQDRFPAGMSGFLERRQLAVERERTDGAVVITIDDAYRVYCRPAPHGDLVLEIRLRPMPDAPYEREEILRECLTVSWIRMADHAEFPVLSPDGGLLLLHQRIPSDASVDEFEACLENFVNAAAEWRRVFKVLQ